MRLEGGARITPVVTRRDPKLAEVLSRANIPNTHYAGRRDRGDLPGVRAEASGDDDFTGRWFGVRQPADFSSGGRIPQARRAVPGRRDYPRTIGAESDVVDIAGVPAPDAARLDLAEVP